MRIIDNFSTAILHIRYKLKEIIMDVLYRYIWIVIIKKIVYVGNGPLLRAQKGVKLDKNANYRQFLQDNSIYSLQIESKHYGGSLQINLDGSHRKILFI